MARFLGAVMVNCTFRKVVAVFRDGQIVIIIFPGIGY